MNDHENTLNPSIANDATLCHRPVLILGNGPSAKLVDFERLRDGTVATIGMNAAYRLWDRIDFRPSHYMCMDTVVVRSHAQRIAELLREGRIERYFLRNEFLELFPEFQNHPRILWFDDLRARSGSLFDTHWVTTGSWAIRWAAFEGCRLAALIGIDANYVELLPEATRLGSGKDLRLELTSTPRFNPNYFFAEYQQAGDRYNVPNDPVYLQNTGGLVHVDALREAAKDVSRLGYRMKVVDTSPISSHGVFPKAELDRLFAGRCLALVTSFFGAAPADEVCNNIRIALANAANPDIHRLRILFEGVRSQIAEKAGVELMSQLEAQERAGRIEIVQIERRPDYLFMFESARSMGQELCAVANADILLTRGFTAGLLAEYMDTDRPFLVFTRWNRTANGLFIQGQIGHPPWQEVAVEDLDFKQINWLSFDLYCFDKRTPLPTGLRDVPIGTFGCDTAIAAVMRIAGQSVANPCLSHRVEHIDEKIRDYSSKKGQAQMVANSEAVRTALLARFDSLPALRRALQEVEALRHSLASVGTPEHSLGRWHCIQRMLGASPWRDGIDAHGAEFKKVVLHIDDFRDRSEQVLQQLTAILDAGQFLELEMGGHNGAHYMECMGATAEMRLLRDRLFRYDLQSVVFIDLVTDDERRIHSDMLLIARQCLQMGSGAIDRTPGAASLVSPRFDKRGPAEGRVAIQSTAPVFRAARSAPRVLVIDPTPVGHPSATGQIKAQFLRDHPTAQVMQVWERVGGNNTLALFRPGIETAPEPRSVEITAALEASAAFDPEVVYCRPINSIPLLEFTARLLASTPRPLVVHMMDDWPERARRTQPALHQRLDFLLRRLLTQATVRLSISEPMSRAFAGRYGGDWTPLANGVDVDLQPFKDWSARPPLSDAHPFIVRYFGGFAADMGATSITDVARAVSDLQAEFPIRFELFTMPWYLDAARAALRAYSGVRVEPILEATAYSQALAAADALLVAYNFDEESLAYCGLSMANKMPECLAAGVPVLAYGPAQAATIDALAATGAAEVVTARDETALRRAIIGLASDLARARLLGEAGRAWVAAHKSGRVVRHAYAEALNRALAEGSSPLAPPPLWMDRGSGLSMAGATARSDAWRFSIRVPTAGSGCELHCLVQIASGRLPTVLPVLSWAMPAGVVVPSPLTAVADRGWVLLRSQVPPEGGEVMLSHHDGDAAWDVDAVVVTMIVTEDSAAPMSLVDANRLWRERSPEALSAYLTLFAQSPRPIYARNAVMCAPEVATSGDGNAYPRTARISQLRAPIALDGRHMHPASIAQQDSPK
jgi:glycosyltransferase involved in cell wall biosynthesis